MIIDDFNIEGIPVMPFKADSPLLVNSNRILPLSFASEGMELIAWIQHQGIKAGGCMQNRQSPSRLPLEGLEPLHSFIVK